MKINRLMGSFGVLFNYHSYSFWIDWIRDNTSIRCNVIDHFIESRPFDFFPFKIR